jgi:hypothetical protein
VEVADWKPWCGDDSCCRCVPGEPGGYPDEALCLNYAVECTSGTCNDFVICEGGQHECPEGFICYYEDCGSAGYRHLCFPPCGVEFIGSWDWEEDSQGFAPAAIEEDGGTRTGS